MLQPLCFTVDDSSFTLIPIEGDDFDMGMEKDDPDSWGVEQSVHVVNVPDFYLARYPVTQLLWKTVMEKDWEHLMFSGDQRPMERVSWDDIQVFLEKLNERKEVQRIFEDLGWPGASFRLPSEAEWEFAARGGVLSLGCKYAGSRRLKEVAWFDKNSHGETKAVGCRLPNELGLYDMSGNVWEWCEDDWHGNYNGAPDDGSAWVDPERGSLRVSRGGSWDGIPQYCRSAYRDPWLPVDRLNNRGFRLALSLQLTGRPDGDH